MCFTVAGISRHSALNNASVETTLPYTDSAEEIPLYFDAQAATIRDIVRNAVSRDMYVVFDAFVELLRNGCSNIVSSVSLTNLEHKNFLVRE